MEGVGKFEENRRRALDEKRAALESASRLREQGYDVNPHDVQNYLNGKTQESPDGQGGIFSKYTDRYKMQVEQDRLDREANRRYKEYLSGKSRESDRSPEDKKTSRLEEYKEKLALKRQMDKEAKEDPQNILADLNAESKNKVGGIASGLQALDQMEKSMNDGHGPRYIDANTPIIGKAVSDSPFDEGQRMLDEVVGRLQSGGMIGEGELKTFRAMGPRTGDDLVTRKRKLAQQKDFLANKLTAYNLKPEHLDTLGFATKSSYQPKNKSAPKTVIQNGHTYILNEQTGEYE
jgi:ribosome modulation factor